MILLFELQVPSMANFTDLAELVSKIEKPQSHFYIDTESEAADESQSIPDAEDDEYMYDDDIIMEEGESDATHDTDADEHCPESDKPLMTASDPGVPPSQFIGSDTDSYVGEPEKSTSIKSEPLEGYAEGARHQGAGSRRVDAASQRRPQLSEAKSKVPTPTQTGVARAIQPVSQETDESSSLSEDRTNALKPGQPETEQKQPRPAKRGINSLASLCVALHTEREASDKINASAGKTDSASGSKPTSTSESQPLESKRAVSFESKLPDILESTLPSTSYRDGSRVSVRKLESAGAVASVSAPILHDISKKEEPKPSQHEVCVQTSTSQPILPSLSKEEQPKASQHEVCVQTSTSQPIPPMPLKRETAHSIKE
ncbi:hypothetical protein BaRGS_00004364 [Batillaria attramentaria]|uniref:Uncharacterized protein n=1 Tax=Batillaria attramentaria TaxID=370345 RepID=A0ABD0LZQ5_9CAEN